MVPPKHHPPPNNDPTLDSLLKIRSTWTPDTIFPDLQHFILSVCKDLLLQQPKRAPSSNIPLTDLKKIIDLAKNPDITIKKADKGNAIIILDTVDYLFKGFRQLPDKNFYRRLDYDSTLEHEVIADRIVHLTKTFIADLTTTPPWNMRLLPTASSTIYTPPARSPLK